MTATNSVNKSAVITNLDTQPIQVPTAGEGAAARLLSVDDIIAISAADAGSTVGTSLGSTYRLCRFPTTAKIKDVVVATDSAVDSDATPTFAMSFSLAFSDSAYDGTPSAYQGLLPSATLTGVAPVGDQSSSRNKAFGTITMSGTTGGATNNIPRTNIVWGSVGGLGATGFTVSAGTFTPTASMQPAYKFFGYLDGKGNSADPGGKFDLLGKIEVVAKTGHAANLYALVKYAP